MGSLLEINPGSCRVEGPWIVDARLVRTWMLLLDRPTQYSVAGVIRVLEHHGPHLGRPLVDRVRGSEINNLKELRPPSQGRHAIRILFVFDPRRTAVLLVGGDKRGTWNRWYPEAITQAEHRYEKYLMEKGMN